MRQIPCDIFKIDVAAYLAEFEGIQSEVIELEKQPEPRPAKEQTALRPLSGNAVSARAQRAAKANPLRAADRRRRGQVVRSAARFGFAKNLNGPY